MTKKKLTVKVDKRVINAAQIIFERLGMTVDEAVNMFLYQVLYSQSIPFSVKLPTDEEMERFDLYLSCLKAKKILRPAGIFLPKKYLLVSKKSLAVIQRTVPILNMIKLYLTVSNMIRLK